LVNQLLISLANSVLGTGKSTSKGNYAYYCPFCSHKKRKLEINFTENKEGENRWQCWVCLNKGKKLINLFKKLNVSPEILSEVKSLTKTNLTINDASLDYKKLELPKEFKSLIDPPINNIIAKHAIKYIKQRNLTKDDIIKYNIGYCEGGEYKNMIIIPSYDANCNLNYFVSRSFKKDDFIKYRNPDTSRDIIPFEIFINWDLPIILCEGVFDAFAIKRNVIPLLGKNIQNKLMKKLISSNVKKIYIALDKDAQKQSLNICEQFMNEDKEVYLVDLDDKDPSEMRFENFTNLIQTVQPLTFSNLFEKKLKLI
jgi:hypothetical protein